MEIISLNGTDNTGKTTHSKLLTLKNTNNIALIWSISNYNTKWQSDANQKERRIDNKNEEDFIALFVESILARNSAIEKLKGIDIAILDRGLIMLETTIIANLQIKKWISRLNAQNLFNNFVEKHYGKIKNVEDASFLLRYSNDISENVNYTLSNQYWYFSREENERYKIYQKYLNEWLIESINQFDFLVKANTPIMTTQNTIREAINKKFWYNIPLFAQNIDVIYGIGWSSESWKSSFWQISRKNHNFINLKLKYFSEIVKNRYPHLSPSSEEFSLYMVAEIDNFADAHYYFKKYSLESLRYPESVNFFKNFWGEKFQSIFIDADKENRIQRYASDNDIKVDEAIDKVIHKDELKKNEWAFEIQKISDYVLYNNSSFQRWEQKIKNVHTFDEYNKSNFYELSDLSELWLPEDYTSVLIKSIDVCKQEFGDRLHLLVLSWSWGRQDVVRGFSDLDLFLVVDGVLSQEIHDFRSKNRFFDNIKVGYTFLDSKKVEKWNFDSKTLYDFRNIRNWEYPIIYWFNIEIPKVTLDDEIKTRRNSIFLYVNDTALEIENATTDNEMLESIKHFHTIMKMLLLIHWIQKEWYKNVHTSFYNTFKNFPLPNIPCVIDICDEKQLCDRYKSYAIAFITDLKKSLEDLIKI